MERDLIIELNSLSAGSKNYEWQAGKEFFEAFENTDVLDADVHVNAKASKASPEEILLDVELSGSLTVACDRCGEPVDMPVDGYYEFSVLHGSNLAEKDGREVLEAVGSTLDLSQVVYDYALLSLPIQCFHEEGECSEEVDNFFTSQQESIGDKGNNPFAALKDLINN